MLKRFLTANWVPVSLAFLLALIVYWHSDLFIDFADEGFLWYGARHVLTGQVPILDFQAYDPGRYYWCAAVMSVFGKGLMSLRLAAGLFQFAGLALGLLALKRVLRSPWALFGAGLLTVFFMLMPCRYFNACLPLIALFFAVRLVENPCPRRHVEAGVCTGLITFIAVNHGFYVFSALTSLMIYLHAKDRASDGRKFLYFLAGLGLGSLPWLYFFLAVPGFWGNYFERLASVFSSFCAGKMKVSVPIPWPWSVSWKEICGALPTLQGRIFEFTHLCSTGTIFIFVILYYLISIPAVLRLKKIKESHQALFVASVFVGFFYLGHIFSRANLVYLGEGIFPVWAGLLAAAGSFKQQALKRIFAGILVLFVAVAFFSMGLRSSILFKTMVLKEGMVWYPVGKDRIWLIRSDAKYCDDVKKLISKYVKPEEPVLLAPLLTTFYCLLEKECPVYELHFHIPSPPDLEKREIRQMEENNVRWAVVANVLIDGRQEHLMSNSHPLLWKYLMENFEFVTSEGLRPGYFLIRKKEA